MPSLFEFIISASEFNPVSALRSCQTQAAYVHFGRRIMSKIILYSGEKAEQAIGRSDGQIPSDSDIDLKSIE
jgi:hypothetical protein